MTAGPLAFTLLLLRLLALLGCAGSPAGRVGLGFLLGRVALGLGLALLGGTFPLQRLVVGAQPALAESDPEARLDMYRDLQEQVQAESPIVIMFQAQLQIAMGENVDGYVNGSNSDFVYYRLVEKE